MKWSYIVTLVLVVFWTGEPLAQTSDPANAAIYTSDIEHFWQAYDQIPAHATKKDSLKVFFDHYYMEASPGLVDFIHSRVHSVYRLVETINRFPEFYASLREPTYKAVGFKDEIRSSFHKLDSLHDVAVFPPTYIVIGRLNSGGTTGDNGLLIGAEFYGLTDKTPMHELTDWHQSVLKSIDEIPHIIAHELIHYQQLVPESGEPTLLMAAIREGTADFIAELISGKHINHHVHDWANPREKKLWEEFNQSMHQADYSNWLFNGSGAGDRPADLGYWMGYKIVESYYNQASDKKQAIHDILNIEDYKSFLKQSKYPAKFADSAK
jgi:hypothetical protein